MFKKLMFLLCLVPAIAFAQTAPFVIPLWKNGVPGFEKLKDVPEQAKDYWVKNINNPSLTVFVPPKDKANGSAVIICPGGGHRLLVFNAEGIEPAKFLNNLGVTVFVLKYRLGRDSATHYTIEDGVNDGKRAMQLVRARASEWGISPDRIGIMGFSAGGEIVDRVAFDTESFNLAEDELTKGKSFRPNFVIQIYPGPLFVPVTVPTDAPPMFLLAADDDPCCSLPIIRILEAYRAVKAPVELHLVQAGGHGFNMGNRSKLRSVNTWPQRLADWLEDNNYFRPSNERPRVMH
jgi:acetyl esterase/lipase